MLIKKIIRKWNNYCSSNAAIYQENMRIFSIKKQELLISMVNRDGLLNATTISEEDSKEYNEIIAGYEDAQYLYNFYTGMII